MSRGYYDPTKNGVRQWCDVCAAPATREFWQDGELRAVRCDDHSQEPSFAALDRWEKHQ